MTTPATRKVTLHYEITGGSPDVLLVHGWTYTTRTWDGVVPLLIEKGHGVLTVDLRGHGTSPATTGAVSVGQLAHDVAELWTEVGGDAPLVCGHSLGGMVAVELALAGEVEVGGLVLVDTGVAPRPADLEIDVLLQAEDPATVDLARWWEMLEPALYSERYREEQPAAVAEVRKRFLAADFTSLAGVFHGLATRPDRASALPGIDVPTTVVVGELDVLWGPADHAALAAAIPDASLIVVPGAGHLTPEEAPAAVAAAVVETAGRVAHARARSVGDGNVH